MEKERKSFEDWYEKSYLNTDIGYLMHNGQYSSRRKQHSWDAWQASANREGYNLVPVDLIERCISHIGIASCHPANSLHDDQQMEVDIDALEKAMIGACDEH